MGGEECDHVETWHLIDGTKNGKLPGQLRFLKTISKDSTCRMMTQCLLTFYDGTFFMLPHAHEFPSNFRGSQTVKQESVLTVQVFDLV